VENEQRYNEMALNKLDDIYSRYFRQMKHSFRFNVELPDPNPSGHEASEVQRNLQSQLGVSEVRSFFLFSFNFALAFNFGAVILLFPSGRV
jgi:hypothetical protein